ncbi:cyanophycin synthetase [Syntrophobotulus glycolicus DSM 8271]|uniref:Cyanophycin synthetase n=1 Tax=Syntrophobotulus glycolicus (strain DSM 8271 / FlGlyR) TaxID=645991 RepID=F0SW74_SYNGF|nr:cyanophycin synthetase [Syntrophobotulus glycolicus]ADY54560.1 cyanophycin synthetase [Syntrophobotulus glycolicus DSM 8271]
MRIIQVNAIEGPNYFHHKPVIRGIVMIPKEKRKTTDQIDGFNERLLQAIPTLAEHSCSRGRKGGFIERIREGTLLGHVLEHVAIEMLNLAGERVSYGKTTTLDEKKGEYEVVFVYHSRKAAIEALKMACQNLNLILDQKEINLQKEINKLVSLIEESKYGPSTASIVDECVGRGIPVQRLSENGLLQLGYGFRQQKIWASMSGETSCVGVDISCDKGLARQILSDAGIPVPQGKVVETEGELKQYFRELGQAVVIKPCGGNQGKGVSTNIKTEAEALIAFRLAKSYGSGVIVERYVKGLNYRFLIVGNKMVACARRVPPFITGDGTSTIKELVMKENSLSMRQEGHSGYLSKIAIDPIVVFELKRKGLSLESILTKNKKIFLRESANLSTGGIAVDVTEEVHPDNAQLAVWSAKAIGLDIAGVDFNCEDIKKSYLEKGGAVLEVNASPGLRMHLRPSTGKQRDVGAEIVDRLFPEGNGRIPIIAVTGTNGKTTVVRMINKVLLENMVRVGMTSSEGVFINDKLLVTGDMTGPQSAQIVLRHPDVQAAVLETARGGILRAGLAYDYADVAVITNVSDDHLGQYGIETVEEMAKVKMLVAERVNKYGYVVLNADDPIVAGFDKRTEAKVIYFSLDPANRKLCKHIALGGTGIFVDKNQIKLGQGFDVQQICKIQNIPLTWSGKAKHNIENILAAIGACWALGYSASQMRKSLKKFGSENKDNYGRLEYYEVNGVTIILDYAHNCAGLKEAISTLRQIKKRRIIGCIGLPGDRRNEMVKKYARIAAQGFDDIFIKEDLCKRGRQTGEIAEILHNELIKAGFQEKNLKKVLDEKESFRQAISQAEPGDIVVVFFEKAEPLRRIIKEASEDRQKKGAYQL